MVEEGICTMVEKHYVVSPQASLTPIAEHVFTAGMPIAAYNSAGSNLASTPPPSTPPTEARRDADRWGLGPHALAVANANEASGSGLPKEVQSVIYKHRRQTALDSPPIVKSNRRKPLASCHSLTYPQETSSDHDLALSLHVRQHRGVPLTHLITTTESYS
jgi:hypothetical protein